VEHQQRPQFQQRRWLRRAKTAEYTDADPANSMRSRSLTFAALALHAIEHATASDSFGKNFLAENKKNPGVIELPSGLQYKVLREGDGDAHPLASTSCECHYEGRTAQEYSKEPKGKKFDSSYDRGSPTSFAPSGVIAGWTEAMQLMVEGDKWEMYIPSELGYGDSGQGGDIGPGNVLVFTMEILKIMGPTKPAERGPPPYAVLESKQALDEWHTAAGTSVVALLRQPLMGKLFDAFKGAARAASKTDGGARFAMSALSKYDAKQNRYTTSEVESALSATAPAILTSTDGSSWAACKTSFSQKSVSIDEVKAKIAACAAAGGQKAEL